ncbi:MAG: sigma-70 family RNA polymerase sigma factor [Acidobacteriota bacterium]
MQQASTSISEPTQGEVTELLRQWSRGEAAALDQLIPIVEAALRQQARGVMSRERPGHTLEPTALVNEVYLRLLDRRRVSWQDRTHFFRFAATVMRRVLVEHARARLRLKRGGGAVRLAIEDVHGLAAPARDIDLLALDQALDKLAAMDPRQAEIVELRFFAGLTLEETSEALGISTSLISREWTVVRAWLFNELKNQR